MRGTARPSPGPSRMLRMLLVLACLTAALACSRAPTEKAEGLFLDDGHSLSSDADADTYTGPAPLTVAFTAHAMAEDRKRFLDAGADGYLTKPFTPEQLNAMIASMRSLMHTQVLPRAS